MIITDDILMIFLRPFQTSHHPSGSHPMIIAVPLGLFISALTCVFFFTTLEDQWDEEMGRMEKYINGYHMLFSVFSNYI